MGCVSVRCAEPRKLSCTHAEPVELALLELGRYGIHDPRCQPFLKWGGSPAPLAVKLMRALTQKQIDRFHEEGFLVAPDLLSPSEVDRLAEAARSEFETHRYNAIDARFPAPRKYLLSENSLRLADVRLVVDHPRIVAGAAELLGQEVCLSAFVIYAMPPGTAGRSEHCDYKPYRPVGSSLSWLFVIVPLVDYTEEIGPLLVSPGSHRIPKLTRNGKITQVRRALPGEIPQFVDTRLRRGQVAFMDMFTWHQAHGNRSDELRFGVYNKYRARSAPPGCGPYLFRDSSAELFSGGGVEILADHTAGRIASTRLLIEDDGRFLMLPAEGGPSTAPGGAAQPRPKTVGSDDDNVIAHLNGHVEAQLSTQPPWVSYVGDYALDDDRSELCRVYACPRESMPDPELAGHRIVWLRSDELARQTGDAYLTTAAQRWLHEPVLRGIGQANG